MITTFEANGCTIRAHYSDDSIYLYDFNSINPGQGHFTNFLKETILHLKARYPNILIYADCNKYGLAVSIKAGAKIVDTFTRVEF